MLDDVQPLLKHLPPTTLNAFQRAVQICSRQLGLPADWVQRWIAFTVIADALTAGEGDSPAPFELKGGVAIELRLRRRDSGVVPRASKDLDAAFHGEFEDIEAAVRAALEGPASRIRHPNFSSRVELNDRGSVARRFRVHLTYLGKSFSNIKLEVSRYEGARLAADRVPAYSLRAFGLEGATAFP